MSGNAIQGNAQECCVCLEAKKPGLKHLAITLNLLSKKYRTPNSIDQHIIIVLPRPITCRLSQPLVKYKHWELAIAHITS